MLCHVMAPPHRPGLSSYAIAHHHLELGDLLILQSRALPQALVLRLQVRHPLAQLLLHRFVLPHHVAGDVEGVLPLLLQGGREGVVALPP